MVALAPRTRMIRDHDELEQLFERASQLPADRRTAFLDDACADASLRAEVEGLLRAAEAASVLFDALLPGVPVGGGMAGPASDAGIHIPGYRIGRRLGAGGMGVVFHAFREVLGGEQSVAVKIVHPARSSARLEARLRDEGRVLARLEHPGIARFIDGGRTPEGLTWIAVQYVEGESILDYCRLHGCSIDERLKLFLEACDAVAYAHRQLVVHRDLKPAHILVTPGGQVRLLDFGIARILDVSDALVPADATELWVTPAYASPERIRRTPVGTATDQYALGCILFELLTGQTPFSLAGATPGEIERIVCTEEPPPPSRRVEGRLVRRLAGDLDTIVTRALAKEPEHRYDSVGQLAEDIRLHLEARPIRARPATRWHRARRFAQRNRAAVIAACAVALALVTGTGLAIWQAAVAVGERQRAEAELRVSEQVRSFVTGVFWGDLGAGFQGLPASPDALLRRAVDELGTGALQPAVRAELLDVLGWAHVMTRDFTTAHALLTESVDLHRELHPGHAELAATLSRYSAAQRRLGQLEEAEATAREALAIQERLQPGNDPDLAETLLRLGQSLALQRGFEEAIRLKRRAVAVWRRAGARDELAGALQSLAGTLDRAGADLEAEHSYREALAVHAADHGDRSPEAAAARMLLADFLATRARDAEAEDLYRQALAIHVATADDARQAWSMARLGRFLVDRQGPEEGLALLRHALALEQSLWGNLHLSTATTMGTLAGALRGVGRLAEAESLFWSVVGIERSLLGPRHPQVAGRLIDIAHMRVRQGDPAGALAPLREGLSIRQEAGPHGLHEPFGLLAQVERQLGNHEAAESALREALTHARARGDTEATHRLLAEALSLYRDWDRPEEAARVRERLAILGRDLP